MNEFSWSGLFSVTSVCSFSFTLFMWILEKNLSVLWLTMGITTLVLTILSWAARIIFKKQDDNQEDREFIS